MSEYLIQDTTLQGIANAIRSKTGETNSITVNNMASKINNIQTKQDLSFITAGADQILSGYVGADANGNPVTGTRTVQVTQFDPPITAQYYEYNRDYGYGYFIYTIDLSSVPDADYYFVNFTSAFTDKANRVAMVDIITALCSASELLYATQINGNGSSSKSYMGYSKSFVVHPHTDNICTFDKSNKVLTIGVKSSNGYCISRSLHGNITSSTKIDYTNKYFFAIKH